MSRRCKKVDRLSGLPEDVHSIILSLMPTKFAVRTSILSKRWRYTWTLIHNLEFDDIRIDSYLHVDRVLMLCKAACVKVFRLHFFKIHVQDCPITIPSDVVKQNVPVPDSTVSKWISEAVRLNVSELDIDMISDIVLPLSLLTCNTLSKLSLRSTEPYNKLSWECPPSINLPNLKTLHIIAVSKYFDKTNTISCGVIFKLIHGCPLLEDLSLKIRMPSNTDGFYIKIPTLKRLRLSLVYLSSGNIRKVVLNVPNLEYLRIEERCVLNSLYVMEDLSSLVKAKVSCFVFDDHLWVELYKGLSKVRSLTLDMSQMANTVELESKLNFPEFPNVKKLVLRGHPFTSWNISKILERFSQLEHVSFKKQWEYECGWSAVYFPASTFTNILTVKFTDTTGGEFETELMKFILKYAVDLKKLTFKYNSVFVSYSKIQELDAELSMYPRASKNCQIHLAPYN